MSHFSADWSSRRLEELFRECFFEQYHTLLIGGAPEPLYLPETDDQPGKILYTRDYFRSALHEIAHWCVAGPSRRGLEDYGYWYAPDGRNSEQQALFEKVEVYPQALELIFCAACGHDFRVSTDNLSGPSLCNRSFAQAVYQKAESLLKQGLPERPYRWAIALATHYRARSEFQPEWIDEVFKD